MLGSRRLTEHQIHSTNDRHSISQKMALRDVVETSQMGETGRTDVAPVGALATVTDNIDTHLTLGGLNGRVGVTRGDGVTLGVEEEVVDQGLHVLLHGSTGRRGDLEILDTDGSSRHLVQALVDDAQGLAELLHADEVAVVSVTVGADREVKFNLVVGIIGLALADIPRDTRTTEHRTSEGEVERIGGGNDTNAPQTLDPNAVIREHLLGLVKAITELGGPLVDIVEKADRDVLVNTTGADIGGVQTGTRDTLVEFLPGFISNWH